MTLVSGKVWVVEKFARGHPKETCQMRVGWVFSAIFDQYVIISRKWCILDTKLLRDGNRKPYASYRMVSLSMTLSDPWTGFQGHGSFKRRVSPKRRILQTQLLYRTLIGNHRQASIGKLAIQLTTPLLLRKPCKLFASIARVCQRQLGFHVIFCNNFSRCTSILAIYSLLHQSIWSIRITLRLPPHLYYVSDYLTSKTNTANTRCYKYFSDNFCKCALIFTIFHCYKSECMMHNKV